MTEEEVTEGSSRIFVQGLPSYLDEKRLKKLFEERGDVTDARIIRTKDGHSRQFGFVGFTSVEQARDNIRYYNNSYIDTSRIQVKFAEKANSNNLARPWSKYSAGSSQYVKRHRDEQLPQKVTAREAKKQKKAEYKTQDAAKDDPELAEFLEVMQPRSKAAIWSNDTLQAASRQDQKQSKARKKDKEAEPGKDGDDLYEDLPEKPRRADRTAQKSKKLKKGGRKSERDSPTDDLLMTEAKDDNLANHEVSDLDYLKSRIKADTLKEDSHSDDGSDSASESEEEGSEGAPEHGEQSSSDDSEGSAGTGLDPDGSQERLASERRKSHLGAGPKDGNNNEVPPISETGRLFLRNLPYQASEADLSALFEKYGELSEVHLVVDRVTGISKGFALVQFMEPGDAEAAFSALDGSIFQGRLLHILPAKPAQHVKHAEEAPEDGGNDTGKDYKKQKTAKLKESAGDRQAWNSLFMRQDTVAEAIASHFNITKAELLDRDAADLPVRMALGEAHVIAMTKKGLEEGGADVKVLEAAAQASGKASKNASVDRSSTAILVKNLPYTATEPELLEAFGKFGSLSRLVLPETRTLAIVEFQDPADARRAFQTLAYRRFQTSPLFLEWAPKGIFRQDAALLHQAQVAAEPAQAKVPTEDVAAATPPDEDDQNTDSSSIFVKNLAWSTSDQSLLRHFEAIVSSAGGSVRAAKVTKKKDETGKMVSAGYGFVECSSEKIAKIALKKLQASMLKGHKLQLSMKKRLGSQKASVGKDKKNAKATKVVVRNVAFEAKSQEIRALFQPFGQVKSVRIPRKFDGSHRGFAFVEFLSHREAVNGIENVHGSHLYGRRLVCEWADEDGGLDDLRAKTAAKFEGQKIHS